MPSATIHFFTPRQRKQREAIGPRIECFDTEATSQDADCMEAVRGRAIP